MAQCAVCRGIVTLGQTIGLERVGGVNVVRWPEPLALAAGQVLSVAGGANDD
jgi:hypothetical protein